MSEVRLYDSRGYPLDDPNGERNEKIRNMSRYGVVFTISYAQPYEMATYFRAYESASGRMEQFYATYTTASNRALLREFREAVIHAAEEDHDLEIERSASGENVLSNLDADDPGQVGTDRQRGRARELLAGGERLRFGVGSYEKAFKLIGELAGARPGMEFAVTEGESTHAGPMSTYDLVVEKGPYVGLEPLGETESLLNPEPETADDGLLSETSMALLADVGYGVAAVVLLVVLYAAVASFAWGIVPLPGAAEVPLSHSVSITVSDTSGTQTVDVNGSTPAETLELQYLNNSNGVVESTEIRADGNDRVDYRSTSVPAEAVQVRVQYTSSWLSYTVAPGLRSATPVAANNDSAPTSTATATPTVTPNETATSTSTATPDGTATPTSTPTDTSAA